MNAPGMIEVPMLAVEPDGRRHEVARLVYVLEEESRVAELEAENEKLRELLVGAYKDMDAWQMVISSSDQWGYGKGCLEQLYKLRDAMRELGIEVE